MKKIIVLNQFALPRDQGGGTRHTDLFSRLDGWGTEILAGNRNHYTQQVFSTADPSFRLIPVPAQDGGAKKRLISWLAYCARATVLGTAAKPDAIYASSPHLLTPLVGLIISKILRRPYILEVRDLWPESFVAAGLIRRDSGLHKVLKTLEGYLVRKADHVVVVTGGWEDHFKSLGCDMKRYTVVPNGTEPYDLNLTTVDKSKLRNKYGIKGKTAIFAGAHGPKDGIDLILDAAATTPELDFLLVGSGPIKNIAMQRAVREGLSNVTFRDPVSKDELPQLLAACDIGIHAITPLPVFRLGMSPNKLFDYMAAGLPVVSNAGESVRSLVGENTIGFVGESHEIARGLRQVANANPSEIQNWSREGKRLISERFSRKAAADSLHGVLEEVCNQVTSRK